jgi:hypothetical protein
VARHQLNDAGPQPGGSVQGLRALRLQSCEPGPARSAVHLTGMSSPNDTRQITRRFHRFLAGHLLNFQFQVLGHQLAHDDGSIEKSGGAHPSAECRRKLSRSVDDALSIVARHPSVVMSWRRRLGGFLDIHQTERFGRPVSNAQENGIAEAAKRTAAFHPVGRVNLSDLRIVISRPERRRELFQFVGGRESSDSASRSSALNRQKRRPIGIDGLGFDKRSVANSAHERRAASRMAN